MSKNLCGLAVILGSFAIFSVACSSKDDGAGPAAQPNDPGIGPFYDSGPSDDGGIPAFNLGDGSTEQPIADAGPDVVPVDNDPGPTQGALIFGTDSVGRLVSFRENMPGTVGVKIVTGLAGGEVLLNVTVRPSNGMLYGLGSGSHVYTIDTTSGVATIVGDGKGFQPFLQAQADGFDINPVGEQIRIQTDVDQDLRLDLSTAKVAMIDGTLSFATGDVNFGQSPNLVGTAYTATGMLYAVDSTRNLLVRLPNPDDGTIDTIGDLGVDIDAASGFDIAKTGVAYGAFFSGTDLSLYTVDLATGAATKKGSISYPVPLTSIAVMP